MKFWRGLAVVSSVVVVAGCSSQRDVAQGDFDYTELEENEAIIVPQGMTPVIQHPDYLIPQSGEYSGPVGREQSIRSPRQVMPLVPGSRVEEGSQEARLWFDAVEDMDNVSGWVWRELLDLIGEYDVAIEEQKDQSLLRTETFRIDRGSRARPGFFNRLSGNRIQFESEQVLEINMQAPTHGRSAMLEVDATNVRWLEDGQPVAARGNLKRDIEVNFLNELSKRMQQNFADERIASVRATRALRHAESPQGNPAYALDTDFDSGWVMMPGVFDYLGFVVEDLSQREGLFYTSYQPGGERGFFSRLAFWRGADRGELDLPRGDGYQFEVDEEDNVFYIVIRHDGELLSEEKLEQMFPAFAEAFSEHSD
ncbi:outer membrane protein assembly factor BamC [Aliidiomarina sp. Khilg15.8]